MKVTGDMTFDATAERVAAMMIDQGFARQVAFAIEATRFLATPIKGGLESKYVVVPPDVARHLLGGDLTLTQTLVLDTPTTGRLTLTIDDMPAKATGPLTITPTDVGCTARYEADFVVRLPLIGGKLERLGAEYLAKLFKAVKETGATWLTDHGAA